MADNLYDYLNQQSPRILSALGNFFKSSGLPAYAMSGPGLQKVKQERSKAEGLYGRYTPSSAQQQIKPEAVVPRVQEEKTFAAYSPAVERAYQQEKARATQLAEQDPLAKKYRVAELTKAYNTASPEEKEKIGLEIWATTNPRLAQKLQPGQLGYEQAQSVAAAQSPFGGIMKAAGDMQFADKISFGAVPATDFGIGLKTPLTGVEIPSVPQIGVEEAFKEKVPGGFSFTEAAKMFEPKALSQTQQAILKRLFEQGIKK